jgi:hypothetical protein
MSPNILICKFRILKSKELKNMKTTMKNFKFLMLLFAVIFCGCPDIEIISGDSQMKIINDCDYSVKIYFDNSYIGKVDSEKEDTWSVPSGTHTVKATCSYATDYNESHIFNSGQTTEIRLVITNKFSKSVLRTVNSDSIAVKH